MANISGLKPWPKGVSGNPHGTAKLPAEIRDARRKNQRALIELVMTCFARTNEEMTARLEDSTLNQLERAVIGLMAEARTRVDAFKYLTELVCGKIPESDPETAAEQMTPEEKLEIMERAVEVLRAQVKK